MSERKKSCISFSIIPHGITLPDNIDLSLKCQRQRLVKWNSTSFLNSETEVDLLWDKEIQFSFKSHLSSTN